MAEQKQKILWNEGKEKSIRNCVFWFVVIYAAVLTFLFVNAEIKLVDAQSELANIKASLANQQVLTIDTSMTSNDEVIDEYEYENVVEEEAFVEEETEEVENTEVEENYVEE